MNNVNIYVLHLHKHNYKSISTSASGNMPVKWFRRHIHCQRSPTGSYYAGEMVLVVKDGLVVLPSVSWRGFGGTWLIECLLEAANTSKKQQQTNSIKISLIWRYSNVLVCSNVILILFLRCGFTGLSQNPATFPRIEGAGHYIHTSLTPQPY